MNNSGVGTVYNSCLMPRSGPCFNYLQDGHNSRRTVWLVPHVIKHKEESDIISWRCNWGNVCESSCLYATIKNKGALEMASPAVNDTY